MNKQIILLSLTTLICSHVYGMDTSTINEITHNQLNQQLATAAQKGEYQEFEKLINTGASILSLNQETIEKLKYNGYYARLKSITQNPYYLILRIIKNMPPV